MEIALTRNRVDFFKPILEQGLLMTDFVENKLETLYSSLVSFEYASSIIQVNRETVDESLEKRTLHNALRTRLDMLTCS